MATATGVRRIFISHVEEDADVALRIADGLEDAQYPTWCYERDALPGLSYLIQTARQIEESAAVVLVISPNSLSSNQVTAEVVRAHESGKPFIPVLIGISHVEFAARQPEWREALGSSTSIALPTTGVDAILPRIRQGLEGLGIEPADGYEPRPPHAPPLPATTPVATQAATAAAAAARSNRLRMIAGASVLAIVAALVAVVVATRSGGGGDGSEVATNSSSSRTVTTIAVAPTSPQATSPQATSPPATSVAPPATTAATSPPAPAAAPAPKPQTTTPSAPPATNPPDTTPADRGDLTTAAGQYDVLDATLMQEWCPSDGGPCLTADGSDRYLVVDLVPAGGGTVHTNDAFTDEANRSSVSFGSGQAGVSRVFVDQAVDVIEVVYGVVPASAASGFVLHWPGNPERPLAVT